MKKREKKQKVHKAIIKESKRDLLTFTGPRRRTPGTYGKSARDQGEESRWGTKKE